MNDCELDWASTVTPSRRARAAGRLFFDAFIDSAGPELATKLTKVLLDADVVHTGTAGLSTHFVGHDVPTTTLTGGLVTETIHVVDPQGSRRFGGALPLLLPRSYERGPNDYDNVVVGITEASPLHVLTQAAGPRGSAHILAAWTPGAPKGIRFTRTDDTTLVRILTPLCNAGETATPVRVIATADALTFQGVSYGPSADRALIESACTSGHASVVIRANPDLPIVTALHHLEAVDKLTFTDHSCPDGEVIRFQRPCIEIVAPD